MRVLIAILRGVTPEEAEPITVALETNGFAIVEVPLAPLRPMDSIARLARRFGERLLIGAGWIGVFRTKIVERGRSLYSVRTGFDPVSAKKRCWRPLRNTPNKSLRLPI